MGIRNHHSLDDLNAFDCCGPSLVAFVNTAAQLFVNFVHGSRPNEEPGLVRPISLNSALTWTDHPFQISGCEIGFDYSLHGRSYNSLKYQFSVVENE
jgi:hypothetical protein